MSDFISCPHCGSANAPGTIECRYCGLKIASPSTKIKQTSEIRIDTPKQPKSQKSHKSVKDQILVFILAIREGLIVTGISFLWILFCPVMLNVRLNKQRAPIWKYFLSFFVYVIWAIIWAIAIIGMIIESGK